MQYTKSYGCPLLYLKEMLLLDFLQIHDSNERNISQIHDCMRKTQTKNIAETCFDTVLKTLTRSLYLTLKKAGQCQS